MEETKQDKPTRPHRGQAKIFKIISNVVTAILVILIVFLLFTIVTSKGRNGMAIGPFRGLTILTGSMEPTIHVGSLIITKEVNEYDISIGDIITYEPVDGSEVFVTHRVVAKTDHEQAFVTKGDANNVEDKNPVTGDEIIGRVILTIPMLGAVLQVLGTPQGLVFVVFLFVLFLILEEFCKRIFK